MKAKLTKRFIESNTNSQGKWTPSPEKDLFVRDTGLAGFGLKVTPTGTVSYIYENRIKGSKSKRTTLGRYPSLPFTEAKNQALDTSKLFRSGIDPREVALERAKVRAKKLARDIPLQGVIDSYFEYREDKTKREYSKVINSLFGSLLKTPVNSITEKQLAKIYMDKVLEGHMPQAQKGFRYLKAIFNHAMKTKIEGEVILTENPVILAEALIPKDHRKPIAAKERYIEQENLFKFIRAIMTTCHDAARDLLLFLLFTGLRDSEAKGIKWEDVDFVKKTLTVRNTKGKSDHSLPMGSFLYTLLLFRYNANDRHTVYVFPNPKGTDKIGSIRKQIDKVAVKSGLQFSPHDLRRTYATLLEQELETSHRVVGRLLNHAPRGVTEKHYLKTKATGFDPLANQLYNWVNSNHDWTDDDGKGRITRKWVDDHEEANPYQLNSLSFVLYGKDIQALIDTSPIPVDMVYLSEANPDILNCFDDIPEDLKNRIFMGADDYAVYCNENEIENIFM